MNSFLGQTHATVENIEKHVRGLADYQSSIQTLYNQLKHTAKFLTEIVHSLGLDDAQIELIMQKINKLQLDIQEAGEVSAHLAGETQRKQHCFKP
jgi:conjugal transfer/entry exclusion protein